MHPILLKTHFLTLYSYGVCVALAMTLAFALTYRRSARAGLAWADAVDLLFILFVTGLVGARLFYVVQNWDYYRQDLITTLRFQEGGLVWYGGFLLGLPSGVLFCRWKKQSVLRWMDFFAPVTALAHAVGRAGCFFNGCCYGRATESVFRLRFVEETFSRFPVQLYESAALAALAAALFVLGRKKDRRSGELFAIYMFAYGLLRFGLEFLRADQALVFHLTLPQWISIALVAGATLFLKRSKGRP